MCPMIMNSGLLRCQKLLGAEIIYVSEIYKHRGMLQRHELTNKTF